MRAIFAGNARDCGKHLPAVFANIDRMAGLFSESALLIFENDSSDNTKAILKKRMRSGRNTEVRFLDGLAAQKPQRGARLEQLRNLTVETVRGGPWAEFDVLVILDCDEVNAPPAKLGPVRQALDHLKSDPAHAAVFANQTGLYYDMWTLRHAERCPGDVWEEVLEYAALHDVTDDEAFRQTFAKRVFTLPTDAPPLEVDSAFGGLGIYKMSHVLANKRTYVGTRLKQLRLKNGQTRSIGFQVCEHVSFNTGIRENGGRLFIWPSMINCDMRGAFPPSGYRSLMFQV